MDATVKTIEKIKCTKLKLLQFTINAIGQGADTDVIVASAKTYINALIRWNSKSRSCLECKDIRKLFQNHFEFEEISQIS